MISIQIALIPDDAFTSNFKKHSPKYYAGMGQMGAAEIVRLVSPYGADQYGLADIRGGTITWVDKNGGACAETQRLCDVATENSVEFCDSLDSLLMHITSLAADEYNDLDWAGLPLFGGKGPDITDGIWSWDATRLLVGTCASDLEIVGR